MNITAAVLLVFLELTFVFAALSLLYSLRKVIGQAPFYIVYGLLFVFTQFISASELKLSMGTGFDFYIGPSVLFLPYLAALMLVYMSEGILAAQRLIIGAMAAVGIFVYLSSVTRIQCDWAGFVISSGVSADSMNHLLRKAQQTIAASVLAQTLDLFMIPVFFQGLRNLKCRLFVCILGALLLTQVVDTVVYLIFAYRDQQQWWMYINSSFAIKALASVWLSMIMFTYARKIEEEIPGAGHNALDIFFAFFGSYGKARELEKDLRDAEGRYRMVIENASEMILLLSESGIILDANRSAMTTFYGQGTGGLIGQSFIDMVKDEDGKPLPLLKRFEAIHTGRDWRKSSVLRHKCFASRPNRSRLVLELAVSGIIFNDIPIFIVIGRDITDAERMAEEREALQEQLQHAQRLDSIGRLAGGVSHDFNNYIHAIRGHLDVITLIHKFNDPKIMRHLNKIGEIAEQAGNLTSQLLGFARKGKYREKILSARKLVEVSSELFMPNSQQVLDFECEMSDEDIFVKGDELQLQQVILNLLLNARDAEPSKIVLSVGPATDFDIELKKPEEKGKVSPKLYCCISVKDNGSGMDKETLAHIFDPFFTTKPHGKGTGMGLSMVYGTISNHNGWIQVRSNPATGSEFFIFIPKQREPRRRG